MISCCELRLETSEIGLFLLLGDGLCLHGRCWLYIDGRGGLEGVGAQRRCMRIRVWLRRAVWRISHCSRVPSSHCRPPRTFRVGQVPTLWPFWKGPVKTVSTLDFSNKRWLINSPLPTGYGQPPSCSASVSCFNHLSFFLSQVSDLNFMMSYIWSNGSACRSSLLTK
jgi:hypothetical protein